MKTNPGDVSPFYSVHPFPWCPVCGSTEEPRVLEEGSEATRVICRECQSQFVPKSRAERMVAKGSLTNE
jgi:hypothetical protein